MTSPKISAVITTYNYARFIEDAIRCVLDQTTPPDEIVVIDDGSTDETARIVGRFAGRGVRYVWQENGGAGSARNRGIAETTGELIAFLDADDRWVPEKLELQLDHVRRYPSAGLVTGSEVHLMESGQPAYTIVRNEQGAASVFPRILVENTLGNPSLMLIRRECFEKAGLFDETLRLGQDWEMWIRIARMFDVGVVEQPLIHHRKHGGSLTAGQVWGRYRSNRTIQRRYIAKLPGFRQRLLILLASQSMSLYYTAAAFANEADRRRQAFLFGLLAALLDPSYKARLKVGLLLRTLLGPDNFSKVRRLVR